MVSNAISHYIYYKAICIVVVGVCEADASISCVYVAVGSSQCFGCVVHAPIVMLWYNGWMW